jgi:hypothetical protein
MIALVVIMRHILVEHMPQGALPKQDQPGQGFVFDRPDPPLRVGVQIGRPGWQDDALDTRLID